MADTPANTGRHYLRFSLRAFLLLVLVIGGAVGFTLHKVREQGIAVAALERLGCSIVYASEYADDETLTVLERLRRWFGETECRNAVAVDARNSQFTDAGLAQVGRLTNLRRLKLDRTQATDAGLALVGRLTELRVLTLNDTQITDAGLAHLESLTQLTWLELNGTHITDVGLAHVEPLTQLVWLGINETQVTDVGVEKLRKAMPYSVTISH